MFKRAPIARDAYSRSKKAPVLWGRKRTTHLTVDCSDTASSSPAAPSLARRFDPFQKSESPCGSPESSDIAALMVGIEERAPKFRNLFVNWNISIDLYCILCETTHFFLPVFLYSDRSLIELCSMSSRKFIIIIYLLMLVRNFWGPGKPSSCFAALVFFFLFLLSFFIDT